MGTAVGCIWSTQKKKKPDTFRGGGGGQVIEGVGVGPVVLDTGPWTGQLRSHAGGGAPCVHCPAYHYLSILHNPHISDNQTPPPHTRHHTLHSSGEQGAQLTNRRLPAKFQDIVRGERGPGQRPSCLGQLFVARTIWI